MIEILNKGFGYLEQILELVREILMKIAGWLPWQEELTLAIIFLVLSFWLGFNLTKKFVTNPLSTPYILYYLIISLMIFIILNFI